MKLHAKCRKREQASARSLTSAVAEVDFVKWSENPNYVYLTEGKNPPNSENLIWNYRKEGNSSLLTKLW